LPGKKKPKAYVFDTSALLAYIEDEDGANEVDDLLVKAENSAIQGHVCFVSLTTTGVLHYIA
jgi:PIN domain nuclease of toxin-antitoxin system